MSSGPEPITPETKVARLLEVYPGLEEELIAAAPAFSKLRNPVLRRTIARVTSLEKAAQVAGIPVRDLVLRLRRAAGIEDEEIGASATIDPHQVGSGLLEEGPADWVDASRVCWTVDADAMLAAGRHPIADVQQRAGRLEAGQLGLIRSSFRPAPLIEMLTSRGLRVAVVTSGEGFATFIAPPNADGEAEPGCS